MIFLLLIIFIHLTMSSPSPINEELLKSINEFISSQSSTVDKKELLEVIKDVFSKHKKGKKGDAVEKVKRKPSAYNIFMKKTMEELKDNGMNAKEKMKRVAEMWKEFKNSQQSEQASEEEEFKEAAEDVEVDEKPKKSGKAPKKDKAKDGSDEEEDDKDEDKVAKTDEKPEKPYGKCPRNAFGPKKTTSKAKGKDGK